MKNIKLGKSWNLACLVGMMLIIMSGREEELRRAASGSEYRCILQEVNTAWDLSPWKEVG